MERPSFVLTTVQDFYSGYLTRLVAITSGFIITLQGRQDTIPFSQMMPRCHTIWHCLNLNGSAISLLGLVLTTSN